MTPPAVSNSGLPPLGPASPMVYAAAAAEAKVSPFTLRLRSTVIVVSVLPALTKKAVSPLFKAPEVSPGTEAAVPPDQFAGVCHRFGPAGPVPAPPVQLLAATAVTSISVV